jgi:polysaccharide pyruvyl transferase WcaK-like protein
MTTALLLQTSHWRDAAHDAVLTAAARELDPVRVVAATADPERTERMTGLPAVAADRRTLLRTLRSVDAVVVIGGRPLASSATTDQIFGLADLYTIATAARTVGKRFAMIGVAAGPLQTRRDAFLARRLMIGSALAVVDEPESADILTEAGVPSPIRVGADLGWLELQEPPVEPEPAQDGAGTFPGEELWFAMTRPGIDAAGGEKAVADDLAAVQSSLADRLGVPDPGVLIQAWRGGTASGADLESAAAIAGELRRGEVPVRVLPPPLSLAEVRDGLSRVALCVTGDQHALMAAAAAGVGVISWPADPAARAMSDWLDVPTITDNLAASGHAAPALVDSALARAGQTLPVVREQIATAGEVVDLLRVLLTDGGELPRTPSSGRADHAHVVRPTGVMR